MKMKVMTTRVNSVLSYNTRMIAGVTHFKTFCQAHGIKNTHS